MTATPLDPAVDVEALARHETAHGVAGRIAGIRVHECRLNTSWLGRANGGVTLVDAFGVRLVGRWNGFAVTLFAGLTAQLRYLDQVGALTAKVQGLLEDRNRRDWEDWLEVRSLCTVTKSVARQRADTLVDQQWPRINRAADRLVASGRLAGRRL